MSRVLSCVYQSRWLTDKLQFVHRDWSFIAVPTPELGRHGTHLLTRATRIIFCFSQALNYATESSHRHWWINTVIFTILFSSKTPPNMRPKVPTDTHESKPWFLWLTFFQFFAVVLLGELSWSGLFCGAYFLYDESITGFATLPKNSELNSSVAPIGQSS